MIKITDMGGNSRFLNPDHIEKMDVVPDTVLNLLNGHRYIVRESADDIIDKIIEFKAKCNQNLGFRYFQHQLDEN